MILLSFVMPLLNSVFSPIQQARYIDVTISEFQKSLENFSARVMFLIAFKAKRKFKKPIDRFISKHNTHDLHDLYFPKGILNSNKHSKCEGEKQY